MSVRVRPPAPINSLPSFTAHGFDLNPMIDQPPADPFSVESGRRSALQQAFLATEYVVNDDGREIVIRVGKANAALRKLLADRGVKRWAFITACNPGAKMVPAHENDERLARLRSELKAGGFRFIPGFGRGTTGDWPAEPSFLVLDIELNEAIGMARRFGQLAIVTGELDGLPELVWCDKA